MKNLFSPLWLLAVVLIGSLDESDAGNISTNGLEEPEASLSSETKTRMIPPPPRLQMDLGGNSPDLEWWRESLKTRNERLKWWRDARFGCFIHWNASALLAGEWQGKAYPGYAEHIQRMAKIPCPVYRKELVGPFNPTKFDADAWVRLIKSGGMRYLVVTAKHHDGFAMWDSDASDYNIVDATHFKRDPTTEGKEVGRWFSDYIHQNLGRLELPDGSHRIGIAPVGKPDGELLRFRALHLKPISAPGA